MLRKAIAGTAKKLRKVRKRLHKRLGRELECRVRQRNARASMVRHERLSHSKKLKPAKRAFHKRQADKAQANMVHWNEELDKAILGLEGMRAREKRLAKKLKHLKEKADEAQPTSSGVITPDAPWNPYKRPLAAWIVTWLERSYAAGWRGVVTSGWRDPAYSESLCRAMCGAPSCPGRCAGRSSNHSGSTFPYGAVDLTDYYDFAAIQHRIGSPLRNALGAQDPVHFSCSGR